MKTWTIQASTTDVFSTSVTVEAETEEEAIEIAEKKIERGDCTWDQAYCFDPDFTIDEVELLCEDEPMDQDQLDLFKDPNEQETT
jgi:hypothetical protein